MMAFLQNGAPVPKTNDELQSIVADLTLAETHIPNISKIALAMSLLRATHAGETRCGNKIIMSVYASIMQQLKPTSLDLKGEVYQLLETLDSERMQALCIMIRNLSSLESVDFANNDLSALVVNDFQELFTSISQLSNLTSIRLRTTSMSHLDLTRLQMLCNCIRNLQNLSSIDLSTDLSTLNTECFTLFCETIRSLLNIKSIYFNSHCLPGLDVDRFLQLCDVIICAPKLEYIDLACNDLNKLDSARLHILCNTLRHASSLTSIVLTFNDLTNLKIADFKVLTDVLRYAPLLKSFDIQYDKLGSLDVPHAEDMVLFETLLATQQDTAEVFQDAIGELFLGPYYKDKITATESYAEKVRLAIQSCSFSVMWKLVDTLNNSKDEAGSHNEDLQILLNACIAPLGSLYSFKNARAHLMLGQLYSAQIEALKRSPDGCDAEKIHALIAKEIDAYQQAGNEELLNHAMKRLMEGVDLGTMPLKMNGETLVKLMQIITPTLTLGRSREATECDKPRLGSIFR